MKDDNSIKPEWFRRVRRSKKWIRDVVKIPETLVKKLKPFGPRFLKVEPPIPGDRKSGKGAVEHKWQERPYTAEEMEGWLKSGGNYGVLCGRGLYEIDLDDRETQERFEDKIETFTVKSGSGEGRHYYIMSDATENGVILSLGKNLGNIQVKNKYVVGPGSIHYTGGSYEIVKDVPFAWVSKAELETIFGEHLAWTGHKQREIETEAKEEAEMTGFHIPMEELVDLKELRQIGGDEWQGEHPIHGSTTGQNFCVNTAKNCWHCFRCNSGGGPLSWLAVKHGLIRCDQAQKGVLRGKIFHEVVELARKEGYDIELETERYIGLAKYFEDNKFVPSLLAKELMNKYHYVTRKEDKTIFVYRAEKGIYTSDGEAQIMVETKKALGTYYRRNRQSEVIADIVASTLTDLEPAPPHLIALENGIFNLQTKKLEPFTPDYFIRNTLPVKYDPQAECPANKKFISEIVDETDIPVLQEIAGYCLHRDYHIHVAVMLIGEGANGKSTFMGVIVAMLSLDNVSTIPLQALNQRFAIAGLEGKLANICHDLSAHALKETGNFKNLTGNGIVDAEHKYKGHFNFVSYAKMVFSANQIPETTDYTTAYFRRWVIINFPNQFLDDDPKTDKDLIKKLTSPEELSGFFNWALEGLERLLENGRFSTGKSVEDTREQYIRMSDPIRAFVMDRVRKKAGSNPAKDDVYRTYILYCREKHLPTTAKNVFSMKLAETMPEVTEARRRISGKIVRCWKDIAVSEIDIDISEETEEDEEKELKLHDKL